MLLVALAAVGPGGDDPPLDPLTLFLDGEPGTGGEEVAEELLEGVPGERRVLEGQQLGLRGHGRAGMGAGMGKFHHVSMNL